MADRANWIRMQPRPLPLLPNQIEADRVIARVCVEWRFRQRMRPWLFDSYSYTPQRGVGSLGNLHETEMQYLREGTLSELRRCSSTEERGDSTPLVAGSTPATAANSIEASNDLDRSE